MANDVHNVVSIVDHSQHNQSAMHNHQIPHPSRHHHMYVYRRRGIRTYCYKELDATAATLTVVTAVTAARAARAAGRVQTKELAPR